MMSLTRPLGYETHQTLLEAEYPPIQHCRFCGCNLETEEEKEMEICFECEEMIQP